METTKLFTILLFLFSYFSPSYSQGLTDAANISVIPPSPNVAKLNQYIDNPQSTATGIPKISIPIFQIKVSDLEIPISLNYHAGGHKVEEIASSFGLGWSLSSQFQISRSVFSIPDEAVNGYLNCGPLLNGVPSQSNITDWNRFMRYTRNEEDTEPDLFYYSTPTESGKFLFDKEGNPNLSPFKMIRIIKSPNLSTWKIINEMGITYTFSSAETTKSIPINMRGDVQTFKSAWLLDSITFPNSGQLVNIVYLDNAITYPGSYNQTLGHPLNPATSSVSYDINSQNRLSNTVKLISKIYFPQGSVEFLYNNTEDPYRCDVIGGKYLKEIVVKNLLSETIKRVKFFYSYFTPSGSTPLGMSCINTDQGVELRLKLEKLIEYSNDNTQELETLFSYNEDINLPSRLSFARDHWGFYNGANNGTLVPGGFYRTEDYGTFELSGADRRSNPLFASANILKQIKYPNGGVTNYDFEGNTCQNTFLPNVLISRNVTRTLGEIIQNNNYIITPNVTLARDYGPSLKIQPITLPGPVRMTVRVYNTLDNSLITEELYQNTTHGGLNQLLPIYVAMYHGQVFRVETIITNYAGVINDNQTNMISFSWEDEIIDYQKKVGGLRIKKVEHFDLLTGNSIIKRFKYNTVQGEGFSSGTILGIPSYKYEKLTQNVLFLVRTALSNIDLGYTQGSPVTYSRVQVENQNSINQSENGYSEYYYTGNEDFPDIYHSISTPYLGLFTETVKFPFLPPTYTNEWRRGYLKKEIHGKFNQSGNKIPISEKNYSYKGYSGPLTPLSDTYTSFGKEIKGCKVYAYNENLSATLCPGVTNVNATCTIFGFKSYSVYTGSYNVLDYVEEKVFTPSNELVTSTQNIHSTSNLLLQETRVLNSKGELISKIFQYPYNFSSGSPYSEMLSRNMIGVPIQQTQTQTFNNVTKTKRTSKTNYSLFQNNILPSSLQNSKGSNALETDFNISQYDDKGNIEEFTSKDGIVNSFIWGYNKLYPVAKVVGKTHSEVLASSGGLNMTIINNPLTPDADMKLELNKIRALSGCFVTTYTYKPLVGITSETDPNGRTIYYEYDSFNRLKLIKDQDGKIVKVFDYKYQANTNQ